MKRKLLCGLIATMMFLVPLHTALAEGTLTIGVLNSQLRPLPLVNDDPLLTNAIELFTKAHPDVAVQLQTDTVQALYANMNSDDPTYDLVVEFNFELEEMHQQKLLVNLFDNASIAAHLERWPDMSMFMHDGALLALPLRVEFELMRLANPVLLEELGVLRPEAGWTWDDFFAIGEKLYAYNQAKGTHHLLVEESLAGFPFPFFVQQYMDNAIQYAGQPVDFDTPIFRSLLEGWKRMIDWNVITTERFGANDWSCLFRIATFNLDRLNRAGDHMISLPVYQQGIRSSIAIAECFIIPANSKRQVLALELLSYLVDPDAMLMEERGDRYIQAGVLVKGDEAFLDALMEKKLPGIAKHDARYVSARPSPESSAIWLEQYTMATRHTASALAGDVSALVCGYLQNEMPLDECIAQLEARVIAELSR